MYLVVSCSLNPKSRSRVLARAAADELRQAGRDVTLLDLLEGPRLPLCDGTACYDIPDVQQVAELVASCEGALIATPIYNYDVSAAAKNLIELTDKAWQDKVVGFLCAAGGRSSYMSVMGLAASLMLDFRCFILPRFVYASRGEVQDGTLAADVQDRVRELTRELVRVATALR